MNINKNYQKSMKLLSKQMMKLEQNNKLVNNNEIQELLFTQGAEEVLEHKF